MHKRIVGAVEIGTSKIVVLVGENIDGRSMNIIGVGVAPSSGIVRNGPALRGNPKRFL
jgi:cell division protein FtsA